VADIFISYSNADRAEARLLSAFLESQGFSVWWDSDLVAGDKFRDVIAAELTRARVAIVIWTKNSVTSDWVQSEAGRALREHKLIPVRSADTDYNDIPPPFDNVHTLPLNNCDQMLEAVVAQIAKPAERASVWKVLRFEVLAWLGIFGGAITLVSHISTIINLSEIVNWVVVNWSDLLTTLWKAILFFHFPISPFDAELGTIILLMTSATIYSSLHNYSKVLYRKPKPRIRDRVFMLFPFVVIIFVTVLGMRNIGLKQMNSVADVDSYIDMSFSDAGCASLVKKFVRLRPGEKPSAEEKADTDNCFEKYNGKIPKEDFEYDDLKYHYNRYTRLYKKIMDEPYDDSLWAGLARHSADSPWLSIITSILAILSPVIIPISIYWVASFIFPLKLNLDVLARRLWRTLVIFFSILIFNYAAIYAESAINWLKLIEAG
jgi:hypothetical protein